MSTIYELDKDDLLQLLHKADTTVQALLDRDEANEKVEALKGKLADAENKLEVSAKRLTFYIKSERELRKELADAKEEVKTLKSQVEPMKANRKGHPSSCLVCGAHKGHRRFTCVECFRYLHEGPDTDENPKRAFYRSLTFGWLRGERNFPRAYRPA